MIVYDLVALTGATRSFNVFFEASLKPLTRPSLALLARVTLPVKSLSDLREARDLLEAATDEPRSEQEISFYSALTLASSKRNFANVSAFSARASASANILASLASANSAATFKSASF